MTDPTRTITLTLTADDYIAANKLFTIKTFTSRWRLAGYLIIVAIFVLSLFAPESRRSAFTPFYIMMAVGFALPFFQYFYVARAAARKSYAAQKTLRYETMVSWTEDNVTLTNQQGGVTIPWSDFLKWADNDKVFLLFQGPRLFNMLPKRALTAAQIDDLRAILTAKVKPA
jgi:hypothetical protein